MSVTQRVKRAAGTPLRQFFDRRFSAIDTHVDAAAAGARDEIAVASRNLLEQVSARLEQTSLDLAAVSRAHLESMSYVAAELSRLESTLGAELMRLSERLARAQGAADTDPYAVRALAGLPAGARVLTVDHRLERAPYYLATLGYRVTALGHDPYPVAHPNLNNVLGTPGDLAPDGEPYDAVVVAPDAVAEPAQLAALVGGGGLVVLALPGDADLDVDGLELVDRCAAGDRVMLTLRRTVS